MKKLTAEMEKIVNSSVNKPVIVSADAGSGKTFTLVEKVKKILDDEREDKVLVLSFSNESVKDLDKKIDSNRCEIRTFHSFLLSCVEGYNFISPTEGLIIKKTLMQESLDKSDESFSINTSLNSFLSPVETLLSIYNEISSKSRTSVKEYLLNQKKMHESCDFDKDFEEYAEEFNLDIDSLRLKVGMNFFDSTKNDFTLAIINLLIDFDNSFKSFLKDNNLLTYDMVEDIDFKYIERFIKKENIIALMVDEFQDVNFKENNIVDFIESLDRVKYSFKLGDSKQAIYFFRGCDNRYFKKRIEKEMCYELTKNFRTSNGLLKIFNERFKTKTYSDVDEEFSFNKIKAYTGGGELKYKVRMGEKTASFKSKKEQSECLNSLAYDQIIKLKQDGSTAILVSKRSDLNKFNQLLSSLGLSKKDSNLTNSNELKFFYYYINCLIGVKEDDLILIPIESVNLDYKSIKLDSEALEKEVSDEDFIDFLRKGINNYFDFPEKNLNEILDIVILENCLFKKNKKAKKVSERLENILNFIEKIFDSDIVLPSKVVDDGNIIVLTKHASKGLEFDSVVNIISKSRKVSRKISVSDFGIFTNFISKEDGFLSEKPSVGYLTNQAILEEAESEQDDNLEYVTLTRAKRNYLEIEV